ncbi:mannose-6-phosphate isomerase, class I [Isoptericola sp. b490]|uniref:mannose-6-phosphate isomerase, class I n=1 Tax=Actinotalea lenta TaxID=3064654 RepID=UPI002713ED0B|nr:mannose-6-phosphate isomerase, class I [Isoptericola sp. b490]MDO8119977.1 mannose-6-phosphate isomerase, class I [Isoptericola sp. b490]
MLALTPTSRRNAWGSPTAIPHALGLEPDGRAMAEAWFGAYPTAPSVVEDATGATTLPAWIAADPAAVLGPDVVAQFGPRLPFLVKLLAADSPLSLQLHPDAEHAAAGFAAEEAAGIGVDDPRRSFPDPYGRPEVLYALSAVEAVCGFRTPRRALQLLDGLETPLARHLHAMLASTPGVAGLVAALGHLLDPASRPGADQVREVATECARRLWEGSPSVRADRTVVVLGEEHPGDVGAVASLLLNSVSLAPGEAIFIPPGTVHAYLSGLAVEVLAASDDEVRGALTLKAVDPPALLRAVAPVAGAPVRLAPETFRGATDLFRAPVTEFELAVTTVGPGPARLPGGGPRVLLCLEGALTLEGAAGALTLERGCGAFASARDGAVQVTGRGRLVQVAVP